MVKFGRSLVVLLVVVLIGAVPIGAVPIGAVPIGAGSVEAVGKVVGRQDAQAAASVCTGRAPSRWHHVVVVVMENHGYRQVIGHSPFVDSLSRACGLATNYVGVAYPSLPNYLAMTGGSTFGVHDDGSPAAHPITAPSIFGQVQSRSLQEGMSGTCSSVNAHRYAVKHNPQAYYTPVRSQCRQRDVPLVASPDLSAAYTFITPNLCHDTHDCPLAAGDAFLRGFLPKLLNTGQYRAGDTAIFLTWDSDDRGQGNHIATVVIAPSVRPGTRDGTAYNHYSLLRTTEQMLGVPALGNAARATSMRTGMHL